jgi:hypothetical protein
MDPITTTLIAAGLPALVELIKGAGGAISRNWLGMSVDDQIKVWGAEVERLKALAGLDTPVGTPSQWVVDLRASFRYVSAAALILGGLTTIAGGLYMQDEDVVNIGIQLAGFPFGFLFGERMTIALKGMKK